MTPESKVKAAVKKILAARGAWFFMPSARAYGTAGVPDFIGCYKGRFFAIETKARGNKPTALQVFQGARLVDSGAAYFVIYEDTVYKISQWLNEVNHYVKDELPKSRG